MPIATLTSKGQITVPKSIRDSLHIHTGDKIEFLVTDDGEGIIRPLTKGIDEVYCKLHNASRKSVSIDEIQQRLASRFKEKYL